MTIQKITKDIPLTKDIPTVVIKNYPATNEIHCLKWTGTHLISLFYGKVRKQEDDCTMVVDCKK